jgi:hypothetical protein
MLMVEVMFVVLLSLTLRDMGMSRYVLLFYFRLEACSFVRLYFVVWCSQDGE